MALQDKHLIRAMLVCLLGLVTVMITALIFSGCSYAVIGSAAGDIASTRYALAHNPQAREGNPLMQGGVVKQAALKAVGTATVLLGAKAIEDRGHRVTAKVLKAAYVALNAALVINNTRIGRMR